jgi:indole-3-glycerol phosphate synthase
MTSDVPSVLAEIVDHKRQEVAAGKAVRPRFSTDGLPPTRGFAAAISSRTAWPRLIAEVKHASPVKGVLREDFDPVELARTYAESGAAALSVLTDERFFQGHPDYLRQIRETVSVPLLRKEFIIDEWQLAESRALGADAVLLIVAILSPNQLREYLEAIDSLQMDALVEVHLEAELEVALACGARIIGVNNRNLHTFVTDLATTERFAARVKSGERPEARGERNVGSDSRLSPLASGLLVSESGINSGADVERLAGWGVDAILVGEALVRERDVAAKVRELTGCA